MSGEGLRRRDRLRGSAQVVFRAPVQHRIPFRSPSSLEAAQRRRLHAALAHAQAHVPYYRETLRRLGLAPTDFGTAADLARLPIIERSDIQRDPEYFVSTAQPRQPWVKLQSGGSTGEPVTIFRDEPSVFTVTIHAQRLRSLVARVVGRFRFHEVVISPPSSSGGALAQAFRRSSLISPAVRSKRRWLSLLEPPSEHLNAINAFRPDVIGSYGSYIEALFVFLEGSERPFHRPKVVTYAADPLSDAARELISKRFGIVVLSGYQAVESGQVGFECERHRGFHVNVDFCPVRIVDPEGTDVRAGDSGEVVVSDLTNRATMLLNYRLGDVAAALPGACPCGRRLPMISFLEGRSVEWIRAASGQLVHPQSVRMLLRAEQEIRRYQVIQQAPDRFDVALVTAPGCDREPLRTRLEHRFRRQFGPRTVADVRFVDELPRTTAGKVRPVISLPGAAPSAAAHNAI